MNHRYNIFGRKITAFEKESRAEFRDEVLYEICESSYSKLHAWLLAFIFVKSVSDNVFITLSYIPNERVLTDKKCIIVNTA